MVPEGEAEPVKYPASSHASTADKRNPYAKDEESLKHLRDQIRQTFIEQNQSSNAQRDDKIAGLDPNIDNIPGIRFANGVQATVNTDKKAENNTKTLNQRIEEFKQKLEEGAERKPEAWEATNKDPFLGDGKVDMEVLQDMTYLLNANRDQIRANDPNFVNRYNPEARRNAAEKSATDGVLPKYDDDQYEPDGSGIPGMRKLKKQSSQAAAPQLSDDLMKQILGEANWEKMKNQKEEEKDEPEKAEPDAKENLDQIDEAQIIPELYDNEAHKENEKDLDEEPKAHEEEKVTVVYNDQKSEENKVEDTEDDITVEDAPMDAVAKEPDAIQMEDIVIGGDDAALIGNDDAEPIADDDADILAGVDDMIAAMEAEPQPINDSARVAVFMEKLAAFGNMYKTDVDANAFASCVSDAWTMMKNGDEQKVANGKKMLGSIFQSTLKSAFDVEKNLSYNEHRLPNYTEIINSTNELLRASMFAFTDLYHDPKSASLFDTTAFGGLNAKEMAELTRGESLWDMDQRSDKAWEIQSKEAKDIADKWLREDKPYEKMISEMNALVEARKNGSLDNREMVYKLAAAEWLLYSNEQMMIKDPEDPINPIPNWGNRYWKAITQTRELLGIDKHVSMRELIQGGHAATAKAVRSVSYNETQIKENVLDPESRGKYDSMEKQTEAFAARSEAVALTAGIDKKREDELIMTSDRMQFSVEILNERKLIREAPKVNNFVIAPQESIRLEAQSKNTK